MKREILAQGALTVYDIDECTAHVYAWHHRFHVRVVPHHRPFTESSVDRELKQRARAHLDLPICDL